ncbi:MAG: hypothetical protein MZW92_60235 [Comamonadaceae bacterium]|nr:hypothetical protein [Comamonadaceae bacterium]
MRSNTRVLEWSCKLGGADIEAARFLHTAREPEYAKARFAVERLLDTLVTSSAGAVTRNFFCALPARRARGAGSRAGMTAETAA